MDITQSTNGQLFICPSCQKIHLEFGHFAIDFVAKSNLQKFLAYLESIDGSAFEQENRNSNYRRKISVAMPDAGIKLQLSNGELLELQKLIKVFLGQQADHTGKNNKLKMINTLLKDTYMN